MGFTQANIGNLKQENSGKVTKVRDVREKYSCTGCRNVKPNKWKTLD